MVFQSLAALIGAVPVPHGNRPDAPRHPAQYGVFRVHAVGEEKRQVGSEIIDVHAPGQVGFDEGETVGQREGKLRDRVRSGFGDVVAGYGHRIKIADVVIDEVLLNVPHHAQAEFRGKNTGILPLVLLQDIGLHGAAHVFQGIRPDAGNFFGVRVPLVLLPESLHLLVNCRIQEKGQDRRRRGR